MAERDIGTGTPIGSEQEAVLRLLGPLEVVVAGLQAYVFALLTSLYLNDAINLH